MFTILVPTPLTTAIQSAALHIRVVTAFKLIGVDQYSVILLINHVL